MVKKKASLAKEPSQAAKKARTEQVSPKKAVDSAVRKIGAKFLNDEDVKATIGDFIKLLQLQKELQDEDAKEIKVTWVEPVESVSEK